MTYDYSTDKFGVKCLELAKDGKSKVSFGAVLVKNGRIIGSGRNRLATNEERKLMKYVDYAIHAEQACILDAVSKGYEIKDCQVYVLGLCMSGKEKGKLTTRIERIFVCHKCPHAFIDYGVSVNIPHIKGWMNIGAEESLEIGKRVSQKGYWKNFVTGE